MEEEEEEEDDVDDKEEEDDDDDDDDEDEEDEGDGGGRSSCGCGCGVEIAGFFPKPCPALTKVPLVINSARTYSFFCSGSTTKRSVSTVNGSTAYIRLSHIVARKSALSICLIASMDPSKSKAGSFFFNARRATIKFMTALIGGTNWLSGNPSSLATTAASISSDTYNYVSM